MGTLLYGTERGLELDDRALAHLQLVFAAKLRRTESFMLGWPLGPEHGSGRVSLWVSPQTPVAFRFDGSRQPAINRAWLNHLIEQSYLIGGIELTTEAEFEARATAEQPTSQP